MSIYAKLIATGSSLPARCVSNDELAIELAKNGIETSNEWIVERTGIESRYYATQGESVSDMAATAARAALAMAKLPGSAVDLVIVATSTSEKAFPSTACVVQNKIGANGCMAFDLQAACTGFIYALTVADAMIQSGAIKTAVVIGSEAFSRITDFSDRATCVLFGDGAGAVVLQASSEPGILASDVHADGAEGAALFMDAYWDKGETVGHPFVVMDGKAVFRLAVACLEKTARTVLDKAGVKEEEIDWLVPHQANLRIISGTAKKLKMPMEKVIITLNQHGNTSAASIPLALDAGVRDGRIKGGQMVLLEGVGAGFTWGSMLMRIAV